MSKPSAKKSDVWINSRSGIALAIAQRFGIDCTGNTVKYWQETRDFPQARVKGNSYSFNKEDCFAWVQRNIVDTTAASTESTKLMTEAATAKSRRLIRDDAREQFEFEQEQGLWVKRDVAQVTTNAALKMYHGWVRTKLENNLPDSRREILKEFGVSPEIIAAFYEQDLMAARLIIDQLEQQCEKGGETAE